MQIGVLTSTGTPLLTLSQWQSWEPIWKSTGKSSNRYLRAISLKNPGKIKWSRGWITIGMPLKESMRNNSDM